MIFELASSRRPARPTSAKTSVEIPFPFFANISWRSAANYPRINQFVGKERVKKPQVRLCVRIYAAIDKWLHLNPLIPRLIKVHFLLMMSTHNPDKMLWELIK